MDGRCKTCKWWFRHGQDDDGTCLVISTEDPDRPEGVPEARALVADGETSLITFADFGCVQWEAKDGQGA